MNSFVRNPRLPAGLNLHVQNALLKVYYGSVFLSRDEKGG